MSDRYWARIVIWPWPDSEAGPEVEMVATWLRQNYGEIEVVGEGALLGAPVLDPERAEVTLEVTEARDGVDEFVEPGLDPAHEPALSGLLRDAGLSFIAHDEGCSGCGYRGEEVSWRPGLARFRHRAVLAGGSPALPEAVATRLLEAGTEEVVVERIRSYFAPLLDYREAGGNEDEAPGGDRVGS